MRVLVACEFSGIVREAFVKRWPDAWVWSCDFLPSELPGRHRQGDVTELLGLGWDLMIAFPPCTYLCSSGLHWNKRISGRHEQTERALQFVRVLLNAPIPRIALENPVGCISTRIRPYDQAIQPFQFGHDASKLTCLWLKNLPKLKPTRLIPPSRFINGKTLWSNQTPSGQNKLGPSPERAKNRSRTYEGIAAAMAEQWGSLQEAR